MNLSVRCACGASLVVDTERENLLTAILNANWRLASAAPYYGPKAIGGVCPQCATAQEQPAPESNEP